MPTDLSTPLTLGLVLLAALPWVVKAFQWIGQRELTRAEDGSKRQDQRLADLEAINAARALADAKRDRDVSDLQRSHGETRAEISTGLAALDIRLQKSSEAQGAAMRQMQTDLRQEITRSFREIMAEKKTRAPRK